MASGEQRATTDLAEALTEALRILDEEGDAALQRFLAARPEQAPRLRERLALLAETGMLGDTHAPAAAAGEGPRRLGEFELLEKLGGGGMGVVYRALQPSLGREVAIKTVRPEHLWFERARARFRREVEAVARLEHEGIVRVYAAGEDGGVPFLVMERVDGLSLDRLLAALRGAAPGGIDERKVRRVVRNALGLPDPSGSEPRGARWSELCCRWVCDLALAVDHAHRHGVLHRDLKPSNIMVTPELKVKLLDFGLASTRESSTFTRTGSQLGSVPYMAPEQLRGETAAIGERTDVYGLGVTLYELLTLQNPFLRAGEGEEDTRRRILDASPPAVRALDPAVSWDVETVCTVAMDPDPARRYPTAADMARDLHSVLSLHPIRARRAGPLRRMRRWAQRKPAWAVGLLLGTLLLVVAPTALAVRERILRAEISRARQAAEAELETQKEILGFFTDDLLAELEPDRAGPEATVREVLDAAAEGIGERFLDRPHVEAAIRETIGHTYMELGALAEAEPHLRRAIELFTEHLGALHAHTLDAQLSLASLFRRQDRLTDAEALGRRLVASLQNEHGFDSEDTLTAANNLGLLLTERGKHEEAEELLARVVDARQRLLGEEHRDTLASMANLGLVYYNSGRLERAEEWWRRELEGSRKVFGREHPDLLVSLKNWGNLQHGLGRPDVALAVYRDVLQRTEKAYGPEHPETVRTMTNVAVLLTRREEFGEAEDLFEDALERSRHLSPDHELRLTARLGLAMVQGKLGRFDAALEAIDEVLELRRAAAEPHHGRIARAEGLRTLFLYEQEAWQETVAQARRTLESYARSGDTGPVVAQVHLMHGVSLRRLERYPEAVEALHRCREILEAHAPRHPWLLHAYEKLAETYRVWGKPDEAARWQAVRERSAESETAERQ